MVDRERAQTWQGERDAAEVVCWRRTESGDVATDTAGVRALPQFGPVAGTRRGRAARWRCLSRGDTCWCGTVRLPSPRHGLPQILLGKSPGPAQ